MKVKYIGTVNLLEYPITGRNILWVPDEVSEAPLAIAEVLTDRADFIEARDYPHIGWRDMLAPIDGRGSATGPVWTQFRNNIYLFAFPFNQSKEAFANFHINHDYALLTPVYPHVHFTVNAAITGTVRWALEFTVAKGHGQEAFPTTSTVYIEQDITPEDQYVHFVGEVTDDDSIVTESLEPDSNILLRITRDNTVANNYAGDVFGIQVDMHYQCAQFSTRNKSPDFFFD